MLTVNKPYKNSARNVTLSTRAVLVRALEEATQATSWDDLWKESDFFSLVRAWTAVTNDLTLLFVVNSTNRIWS